MNPVKTIMKTEYTPYKLTPQILVQPKMLLVLPCWDGTIQNRNVYSKIISKANLSLEEYVVTSSLALCVPNMELFIS